MAILLNTVPKVNRAGVNVVGQQSSLRRADYTVEVAEYKRRFVDAFQDRSHIFGFTPKVYAFPLLLYSKNL